MICAEIIDLTKRICIMRSIEDFNASVMKLVDIGDSKSPVRKNVAVRVRPLVPLFFATPSFPKRRLPGHQAGDFVLPPARTLLK